MDQILFKKIILMKNGFIVLKDRNVKKIRPLVLVLMTIGLGFIAQCTRQDKSDYIIEAVRTSIPLTIDGVLDEPVWQKASPVLLKNNRSGQLVDDNKLFTHVMTCYDDSMFYIAFVCNDPDIWTNYTQRDEHLWKEEAVEVFIEVDDIPSTYVEIEVSPANVLFDSYIVDPEEIDVQATAAFDLPQIKTAVNIQGTLNQRNDRDNRWTVEIAVPFSDLATERIKNVSTETAIKINFYRLDKNQGMESAGYAWAPTGGRFHKPSAFGKLIFK